MSKKAIKVRFAWNFPAMLHIFLDNSKKNEKNQGNCLTYAQKKGMEIILFSVIRMFVVMMELGI